MKTTGLIHRHDLKRAQPQLPCPRRPIHAPYLNALLIVRDPQDQKPLNRLTAVAGRRTFAISADEVDHWPGELDPGTVVDVDTHPST